MRIIHTHTMLATLLRPYNIWRREGEGEREAGTDLYRGRGDEEAAITRR